MRLCIKAGTLEPSPWSLQTPDLPWSAAAFGYGPVLQAMSSSATETKTLNLKENLLQAQKMTFIFKLFNNFL